MHLPTWWSVWGFFKFAFPVAISTAAFLYVQYDRRPHLALRARAGIWCMLREMDTSRGKEIMFEGIIEIYNMSARANAVRAYRMMGLVEGGDWMPMECQYSFLKPLNETEERVFNQTPLTLAPYSGTEARVLGFARIPRPKSMQVRIQVEDLFGKTAVVLVTAYS